MTEREFWSAMEYRLRHELGGMAEREYHHLWCDGFDPELYELDQEPRLEPRPKALHSSAGDRAAHPR